MNLDMVKKILAVIIGLALVIALAVAFFYVIILALIIGLIYFIYRAVKRKLNPYKTTKKNGRVIIEEDK